MVKRSNSICFTEHSPGHLALNLLFGPIRMAVANPSRRKNSSSIVRVSSHGDALGGRLLPEDFSEIIVDDLDVSRIDFTRHNAPHMVGLRKLYQIRAIGRESTIQPSFE